LSVEHECFASPLNCYLSAYNSAFDDTDLPFASRGSFWKQQVDQTGGSFQVNPPFLASVMLAMVNKIEKLLDGQSGEVPLSFAITIPGWCEDDCFQRCNISKYQKQKIVISRKDHGFCDGAQHQRRDRFRESPYDTAIFVLQNAAGAAKWPTSKEMDHELRRAFATGVPTA